MMVHVDASGCILSIHKPEEELIITFLRTLLLQSLSTSSLYCIKTFVDA